MYQRQQDGLSLYSRVVNSTSEVLKSRVDRVKDYFSGTNYRTNLTLGLGAAALFLATAGCTNISTSKDGDMLVKLDGQTLNTNSGRVQDLEKACKVEYRLRESTGKVDVNQLKLDVSFASSQGRKELWDTIVDIYGDNLFVGLVSQTYNGADPTEPSRNSGTTTTDREFGMQRKNIRTLKEMYSSGGITVKVLQSLFAKLDERIDIMNADGIGSYNRPANSGKDDYGKIFMGDEYTALTREQVEQIINNTFNGCFDSERPSEIDPTTKFWLQMSTTPNLSIDSLEIASSNNRVDPTKPILGRK